MTAMNNFTHYLADVKSQLICNATPEFTSIYTTFDFSEAEVDANHDHFKSCFLRGMSPYYALFFFGEYLRGN